MAMLSLLEAAKEVGKSKATLWRAAKTGALSVTKNEAGLILVDSSELFRVFQAKRSEPRVMTQDEAVHVTHEADDTALRLAVAETKIEALHAMVQELQRARDAGRRRPSGSPWPRRSQRRGRSRRPPRASRAAHGSAGGSAGGRRAK
jgi:hypothetical protein